MKISDDDLSDCSDSKELSDERKFDELMQYDVVKKPKGSEMQMESSQFSCNPVAMRNGRMDSPSDKRKTYIIQSGTDSLPNSKKSCQICDFEGRGRKLNSVNYCPTHRIRACTLRFIDPRLMDYFKKQGINQIIHDKSMMDEWLCPDTSLTCWEKAHSFYIPNGLFHSNFKKEGSPTKLVDFNDTAKFDLRSKLYLLRKETLKCTVMNRSPDSSPESRKTGSSDSNRNSPKNDQYDESIPTNIMTKSIMVPIIDVSK